MTNDTTHRYTASLDAGLQTLYGGLRSRADDSADISAEVMNINNTIADLALKHLDPLQPAMDFKTAMLTLQDASNTDGAAT